MIRQAIQKVVELAESGETWWCASFTDDDDNWFQITWDCLNLRYPKALPPSELLQQEAIKLAPHMDIQGFEPGKFLTLTHGAYEVGEIADFIDDYVTKILGTSPDAFTQTLEEL